jgi:hypothetical protein
MGTTADKIAKAVLAHERSGVTPLFCLFSDRPLLERPVRANPVGVAPRAQALHGRGGRKDIAVGVTPPSEVHSDRQAAAQSGGDGRGGVAAEMGEIGRAPADQRIDLLVSASYRAISLTARTPPTGRKSTAWVAARFAMSSLTSHRARSKGRRRRSAGRRTRRGDRGDARR